MKSLFGSKPTPEIPETPTPETMQPNPFTRDNGDAPIQPITDPFSYHSAQESQSPFTQKKIIPGIEEMPPNNENEKPRPFMQQAPENEEPKSFTPLPGENDETAPQAEITPTTEPEAPLVVKEEDPVKTEEEPIPLPPIELTTEDKDLMEKTYKEAQDRITDARFREIAANLTGSVPVGEETLAKDKALLALMEEMFKKKIPFCCPAATTLEKDLNKEVLRLLYESKEVPNYVDGPPAILVQTGKLLQLSRASFA